MKSHPPNSSISIPFLFLVRFLSFPIRISSLLLRFSGGRDVAFFAAVSFYLMSDFFPHSIRVLMKFDPFPQLRFKYVPSTLRNPLSFLIRQRLLD